MEEIELTRGRRVIIDEADYDRVAAAASPRWRLLTSNRGKVYAATGQHRGGSLILMHRLILGLPPSRLPQVDHINGNGLDNQRSNLRVATPTQNQANSPARGGTSRFKGVSWVTRDHVWRAYVGSPRKHLGDFHDEVAAARAYDAAALALWGEYAWLNHV